MNRGADRPVLQGGPLLIGHRGAAGLVPENTIASFRAALEAFQADMIELDVRLSADGRVVVIHDETVDRTTEGTGPVAALTLDELRTLDAGYRFAPAPDDAAPEPPSSQAGPVGRNPSDPADGSDPHPFRGRGLTIPTLDEVLEAFPDARIFIEIKTGVVQSALRELIRRHGAASRVVVGGMAHGDRVLFHDDYTGAVSGSTRDIRIFYLLHRLHLARFWSGRVDVFQVPERKPWDAAPGEGLRIVSPRFVRDAGRRGVPVHVWTVNDPADMARLVEWGVDGLITDRPDLAARVLAERTSRPLPPGLD